jgi:histidine decarboxylase
MVAAPDDHAHSPSEELAVLDANALPSNLLLRPALPDRQIRATLETLTRTLERARTHNIGFPSAVDFDYRRLEPLFRHVLNNVGDPGVDGAGANHTKAIERAVVGFVADLMRAPQARRWGYVTTGGSEGNLCGLYLARGRLRHPVVYRSEAAHYSVDKAIRLLTLPSVTVTADANGEIDYDDLATRVGRHRHRPALVVANIGTTMTEAVDDVRRIREVLDEVGVREAHVHADAALSGIPLALLDPAQRPGFDLADGADSISVSGHKFVGSPFPCGVIVVRARPRRVRSVDYIGTFDTTITGSRSGHAPLLLWYAFARYGRDGLRARADASRRMAAYAHTQLTSIGWEAWRNELAFTVVLKTPPAAVTQRWVLANAADGWSHLVCMPGVTSKQIDAFVRDLAAATGHRGPDVTGPDTASATKPPTPRRSQ